MSSNQSSQRRTPAKGPQRYGSAATNSAEGNGDLEARLRGLILNNDSGPSTPQRNARGAPRNQRGSQVRSSPSRRGQGNHQPVAYNRAPPPTDFYSQSIPARTRQQTQANPVHASNQLPPVLQPPRRGNYSGRGGQPSNPNSYGRPPVQSPQLYQPPGGGYGSPHPQGRVQPQQAETQEVSLQNALLDDLALTIVVNAEIGEDELRHQKEFCQKLEEMCKHAVYKHETSNGAEKKNFSRDSVQLRCFGSMSSGFGTKSSDMDLALVSKFSTPDASSPDSPIPRILEKALLEKGYGARLLTNTRVPIIKLCEKPSDELLADLLSERHKWETQQHSASTYDDDAPLSPTRRKRKSVGNLSNFSQRKNETLLWYSRRAKRLLEESGGHDNDWSQKQSTDPENDLLLVRITQTFVNGLSDVRIRSRLLESGFAASHEPARSLSSLAMQATAEEIAVAWDSREIVEAKPLVELQGQVDVRDWRMLQNNAHKNMFIFQKSIPRNLEKLKRLVSPKLVMLSEREGEQPEAYFFRAEALLNELCERNVPCDVSMMTSREVEVSTALCHSFVDGIRDEQIRERLGAFISSFNKVSLKAHLEQYQAERRVKEYLKAAEVANWSAAQRSVVEDYANWVRLLGASSQDRELLSALAELEKLPKPSSPKAHELDPYLNRLEIPKSGVGIQCDINFSNYLALHNTKMLRCYSLCDKRVRPMVLFVKAWAKRREINSPYRGTLSSYGYVLMVLHFLANVASPPVVPNLQLLRHRSFGQVQDTASSDPNTAFDDETYINGYDVRFWRDEAEISGLAAAGKLTSNVQSLGALLRGFFDYYANQGFYVTGASFGRRGGFSWSTDVLSLRSPGGLLTKAGKGWTGAKTTVTETPSTEGADGPVRRKEVRHRYLFAIEDPFEVDHNVARTVNHFGICAIRDEFRRAWSIIRQMGTDNGGGSEGGLFDDPVEGRRSGDAA